MNSNLVIEIEAQTHPEPHFETVGCDLCGSVQSEPRFTIRDHIYGLPGIFTLVRCTGCGLLYLNPRPDRESIGAYYPDLGYHAFQKPPGWKAAILNQRREQEARELLAGLPDSPHVLEIGCGTGDLLAALHTGGARVLGVEPNTAAAQAAEQRHEITVHVGMLDDWYTALPHEGFDLILMKYALEHVYSPKATLEQISRLLKPGGRAVFWIPNGASLDAALFGAHWRGLDAPRHLYIFTPTTIRRYADGAGLHVADIQYSGVPNDWAGSVAFVVGDRSRALAKLAGVDNPLMLAAWTPISMGAAALRRAGRMRVVMIKPNMYAR